MKARKKVVSALLASSLATSVFSGMPITAAAAEEPVELDLFVDFTWYPMTDWLNPVAEAITEATGVKLNITVAADDNQLQVLIASGDLPDLVFADNSKLKRLSDPNLCYPWNELIEEYAPDFEVDPARAALYADDNGNYYTLLDQFSDKEMWDAAEYCVPFGPGLILREDILEELGNPQISSFDDLDAVFSQVKETHPEMTPLVMSPSRIGYYFGYQFGQVYKEHSVFAREEDGNVVYSIAQDGRLDYYKKMNEFVRKGYVNVENFAYTSEDDAMAKLYDGSAFAFEKESKSADEVNSALAAQGEEFRYVQLLNNLTDEAEYPKGVYGWAGVFISKNNRNPEASINFLKYLLSEEGQRLSYWGIEGVHYTMNEKGYPDFLVDVTNYDVMNAEGLKWYGILTADAVTEGYFLCGPALEQTFAAGLRIKEDQTFDSAMDLVKPEADSKENNILNKLNEMVSNEEANIYTAASEEECEAAYNHMLELANQIGMAELNAWATDAYKAAAEKINNL